MGPYTISAAMDAPAATGVFPLVVISHGTGGSHLLYRTVAGHLARHGYVVVMPEHPRNNRNDNALGGTAAILVNRPRHVRVVMDWAFGPDGFDGCVQAGGVALIGHSLGGYTALALAGGVPTSFPNEWPDRLVQPLTVTPDPRVQALVLLAPATPWFKDPGALRNVRVPVLMFTGEKDGDAPAWFGDIVARGLPDPGQLTHVIVPNAGHYSFLAPFPPRLVNPSFAPSQDPPGFDRAAFHERLSEDVLAFLNQTLGGGHAGPGEMR
jgi:predicted dienelactone hydrolase